MNNKPRLYLICGKARHGKDTFSSYLKEAYEENGKKLIVTQLSKYIKYYAREMTGWNLTEEDKPRALLQEIGTQVIREKLGKEDLFIKRIIDDVDVFGCFYDVIVVSDVRFKKEVEDLRQAFPDLVAIHIERPNFDNGLTPEQKMHRSEIDLDDYDKFDINIVNTTLEKLKEDAKEIYTKIER